MKRAKYRKSRNFQNLPKKVSGIPSKNHEIGVKIYQKKYQNLKLINWSPKSINWSPKSRNPSRNLEIRA